MYVYVCSNVCMLKCMLTRNSLTVFFSRKSWIPPLPSLKWWFLYNRFGHPGISSTLASVCHFYWFPKSSALIREIVLNCSIYLSFKSQSDKRLVGNKTLNKIFHIWTRFSTLEQDFPHLNKILHTWTRFYTLEHNSTHLNTLEQGFIHNKLLLIIDWY